MELNPMAIKQIDELLKDYEHIAYEDAHLYIVDRKVIDEMLLLQASLGNAEKISGEMTKGQGKKKGPLYHYAKLLNPEYPAFKYSFYRSKKPLEIYSREKVKLRIPREINIWAKKQKKRLEERIIEADPPLSVEEAERMRRELEEQIDIETRTAEGLLEHFDELESIAITNYESNIYYPGVYIMTNLNHGIKGEKPLHKRKVEHLRKDVPNILWFYDYRRFNDLRPNDKAGVIVRTHKRVCGTIYYKKRGGDEVQG